VASGARGLQCSKRERGAATRFRLDNGDYRRRRSSERCRIGPCAAGNLGPRTQNIRQVPPHGAAEFPVGSVIVEARESGAMKIFAAVKRGGGFNSGGAANWEWFELSDPPVTIVWRGVGPPLGDTYGGDPNGGCNACHAKCAANDYICSPRLALGTF